MPARSRHAVPAATRGCIKSGQNPSSAKKAILFPFTRQLGIVLAFVVVIALFGLFRNNAALPTLGVLRSSTISVGSKSNTTATFRMFTSPPQKPPTFRVQASDVLPAFEQVIKKSKAINDKVASVTTVNFDTVIKPLALDEAQWSDIGTLSLLQHVSPEKSVRDAATEGQQKLSDYAVEASMREDVYKAVKEVFDSEPALDHEDKRLLTRFELEYRRNGLALPTETQEKIKALQKKMSQISIAFSKNLGEENGGVWFTRAELEGVPEDLVNSWETRTTGKETEYKMTFKYPDIIPTTKYAQLEETRHRAWVADGNKVPQNVELMVEMVQLRQQVASLLGYKNFADYVEEVKMSKTSSAVLEFLDDLGQKLRPAGLRDLEELKAIKKSQGQDGPLMAWDHAWTKRLLVEQQYQVDAAKVAEYFEMNETVANMFGIYEALFSLKFVQIGKDDAHHDVWHEDVKQYAVWRSDTEKFVGWLYMDMFPREGKYGHAANFGIIPGFTNEQGKRVYPVTALVCNFSKPSKDKPSLLKHDEVVTFFHELGHGIHDLMGETKYAKFHGTAVARVSVIVQPVGWPKIAKLDRTLSKHPPKCLRIGVFQTQS